MKNEIDFIEQLIEAIDKAKIISPKVKAEKFVNVGIEAVKILLSDNKQIMADEIEKYAVQFTPKWISVDEGLPEDGQEVNVCISGKVKISTFRINNGFKSFYCVSGERMCFGRDYITGWQPLPQPPTI